MSDSNTTLSPPPSLTGWMAEIQTRLAAHENRTSIEPGPLRRAAVLIPLFVRDGQLWVLFTRRTETVEHHRGQISFPGGGEEADDASPVQTALRETEEEIGLSRGDAIILGSLSPIATVTDFYIEPFVAAIPQPYVFRPEPAEIAEILEVPIRSLMDPRSLETKSFPERAEPVLFYHYGETVIWGATARMLAELLDALRDGSASDFCNPRAKAGVSVISERPVRHPRRWWFAGMLLSISILLGGASAGLAQSNREEPQLPVRPGLPRFLDGREAMGYDWLQFNLNAQHLGNDDLGMAHHAA